MKKQLALIALTSLSAYVAVAGYLLIGEYFAGLRELPPRGDSR